MPDERPPTIADIRRKALLPLQAWWDVFVIEPVAICLAWLLVRLWPGLTPNAVTGLSLLVAVAAACLFWTGAYLWAALAYQLYYVLDNLDGILARLTDRTSTLGGRLDGLTNILAYGLNVAGLFLGMAGNAAAAQVGALLLVVFILHLGIGRVLDKPEAATWANVVPPQSAVLRRHRLLYPLSFPDRHAILFLFGPLSGFAVAAGLFILAVELASLLAKTRRMFLGAGRPS